MTFKIGDRIMLIDTKLSVNTFSLAKNGQLGTVKVIEPPGFGVEFDKNISGHSLDHRCRQGHGRYFCSLEEKNFKLIHKSWKAEIEGRK